MSVIPVYNFQDCIFLLSYRLEKHWLYANCLESHQFLGTFEKFDLTSAIPLRIRHMTRQLCVQNVIKIGS